MYSSENKNICYEYVISSTVHTRQKLIESVIDSFRNDICLFDVSTEDEIRCLSDHNLFRCYIFAQTEVKILPCKMVFYGVEIIGETFDDSNVNYDWEEDSDDEESESEMFYIRLPLRVSE